MALRAAPGVSGAQGFDTDAQLATSDAVALFTAGFRFAIRYLSRSAGQQSGDLSATEAGHILGAGLALMAVQHCQRAGWMPSAALGSIYGHNAAGNAGLVGLPPGVCLWLDLEGILPGSSAADTIGFVNAWADAVVAGGYVPGLYVGFNGMLGPGGDSRGGLSASDLYWRLKVKHYWKSASNVPAPLIRGFQMLQTLAPTPVAGVFVDRDVIQADSFGGLPILAIA